MKITLVKTISLWNVLSEMKAIYEVNQTPVPAVLTANLAYMRQEVMRWNELSNAEREAFAQAEIEIPLVKLKKNQLPSYIAPDSREVLSVIVDGKLENQKSQLEQLIEQKNGQKEKEKA